MVITGGLYRENEATKEHRNFKKILKKVFWFFYFFATEFQLGGAHTVCPEEGNILIYSEFTPCMYKRGSRRLRKRSTAATARVCAI